MPPTWRAKDVVGKPGTTNTYGTVVPSRFGGERRLHGERTEASHTRDFTQLRAARMRKTLLLLVIVFGFLLERMSSFLGESNGVSDPKVSSHRVSNLLYIVHGPPFIG